MNELILSVFEITIPLIIVSLLTSSAVIELGKKDSNDSELDISDNESI